MYQRTLGDPGEAGSIGFASSGEANDTVIAGQLAVQRELAIQPENGRAQGEEHQAELPEEVDPIIAATEVFALVQQNLPEFGGAEHGEEAAWKQDARTEEAGHAGSVEVIAGAELHGARAGVQQGTEISGEGHRLRPPDQPTQMNGSDAKLDQAKCRREQP